MSILSVPRILPRHLAAVALAASFIAAGPASAAHSDWATNEGGRMRLVVLPPDESGRYEAALQIEPKPGWITYWREPGDSGIPPQITMEPGSPFALESVAFPVPKRIDNGPVRDIGYDAPVTLPLTLSGPSVAGSPLRATAFIGICKNICIPFQAEFSLVTSAELLPEDGFVLAEAKSTLPEAPSEAFSVKAFELSSDHQALTLDLAVPEAESAVPQLFLTGPSGSVFLDFKVIEEQSGRLVVEMPIARLPKNYDFSGQEWSLLAIVGNRAMEAPLAFD